MSEQNPAAEVLPAHKLNEATLRHYLADRVEGIDQSFSVRQFQGGQSNPTYLITAGEHQYVLRKKPPGKLLKSAHQIEREYQIMTALRDTPVPVPVTRLLCEDSTVIGTPFYVMDFVPGRVFSHPTLTEMDRSQRAPLYRSLAETLAELHNVDWRAVGLEGFGRPSGYIERQIDRWSKQYQATSAEPLPSMAALMKWLPENAPVDDEVTIAHGDFRLGNVIVHPQEPRVVAVLDWELSTLGHPLADLAYCCLMYHMPPDLPTLPGLVGYSLEENGLPREREFLDWYAGKTGRAEIPHWNFFLAFSLFRLAAILQGIYARALQGNAANADALQVGERAGVLADAGWRIAQRDSS